MAGAKMGHFSIRCRGQDAINDSSFSSRASYDAFIFIP